MARIQQSIEVGVPAHAAYQLLTHFEEYPRFMQEVDTVRRLDGAHLHWSANMSLRTLEWDAEITEQQPDRCIAWRNIGGPIDAERIDLQPLGPSKSRVTMTMECDPLQVIPAQEGNADDAVAERLREDLERFKSWVEMNGAEASTMLHAQRVTGAAIRGEGETRNTGDTPARTSNHAAGSEGWDGSEDPSRPVTSHVASEGPGWSNVSTTPRNDVQASNATQSDNSLSSPSQAQDAQEDDGRFGIAEEQSFDQQSDQARRIGQALSDPGAIDTPSPAADETMKPSAPPAQDRDDAGRRRK